MNILKKHEWLVFVPLAFITHFAFAYNSVLFNGPMQSLLNDSWLLHCLGKSYVDEGQMMYGGEYSLHQLPLYPLLISVFYRVFGEDPRYLLAFQIGLSIVFVNCMVRVCRGILGEWRFLLGLALCFDLHLVLYSACLLTEFWVMSFWALGLFFIYKFEKAKELRFWILSILSFCVAMNIKPLALFLPLFILLILLVLKESFLGKLKLFGIAVLLFILTISPLLVRNYLISNKFPLLTTISALNLWYYNISYARCLTEGLSLAEAKADQVEIMRQYLNANGHDIEPVPHPVYLDRHGHRHALGLTEFEYSEHANKLSSDFLKENFFSYSLCHISQSKNVFYISNLSWVKLVFHHYDAISYSGLSFQKVKNWIKNKEYKQVFFLFVRGYELCYSYGFLLLALIGAIFKIKNKDRSIFYWALWTVVLYVFLITGVNTWGRFRFLFMPFLMLLGMIGLKSFIEMLKLKFYSKPI